MLSRQTSGGLRALRGACLHGVSCKSPSESCMVLVHVWVILSDGRGCTECRAHRQGEYRGSKRVSSLGALREGVAGAWPSLLSVAATWDSDRVEEFSEALDEEFVGNGANAILGPSVNVHRVA